MAVRGQITIVGLGSGDETDLTLGVWRELQEAEHLFLRTAQHPVATWLRQEGIHFTAFDAIYERYDRFQPVYEAIVTRLFSAAKDKKVVYAVPGHPMVAEETTQQLIQRSNQEGVEVEVIGGRSFLEEAFARFRLDPIDGFLLLDGLACDSRALNPRIPTIIAQVYDQMTASDVKLTLMERYPDDAEVIVAQALGIQGEEHIRRIPLYELDHDFPVSSHILIFVPPVATDVGVRRAFEDLMDIVATLRGPDGCPWDREQTHKSLRPYLIEETAEFIEAVNAQDSHHMCEELGDVLLQVALHAQIAAENGQFTIDDMIENINEKLIRRHPHVFGNVSVADAAAVEENWQAIKREEKRRSGDSLGEEIPLTLPTLSRAYELQKRAAKYGFDWENRADVASKVREELEEAMQAEEDSVETELGDLLFAVVNLARFLKVDPELALRRATAKFISRFDAMRKKIENKGQSFQTLSLKQMDALWEDVKQEENC